MASLKNPPPPKKKRGRLLVVVAAIVVLALIAGGVWWQWAGSRLAVVEKSLPTSPDVSAAPGALGERLATASEHAHSLTHLLDGVSELSRLYHANGFLDEAARCYALLEQLAPREPRWPHLHATILAGYGDVEPALRLWDRVVQLAPDYIPARLRIGDAELKINRIDLATAAYSAVLQREPKNAYALFGLARIDFEAGRLGPARERLEAVVNQTHFEIGYDLIVSLYEQIGEYDRARAIRSTAKASGAYRDPPDPWLDALADDCYDSFRLALSAGVAERNGDAATALRLLKRAVELSPNDVSANFQLGRVALDHGDATLAREQLVRCTVLSPEFADAWAWLSTLYSRSGDAAAAEQTLATGLRLCPQSPGLHLMRARNLREANRLDEAANEFQISIRLRPNEPDAYIELGNMLISAGHTDAGIEQVRGALVAEPGNPTALATLTFYAITTGGETEAHRWLARVRQQPRIPKNSVQRLLDAYRETFGHDFVE